MTKPAARGMLDVENGIFKVAGAGTPSRLDTSTGSLRIVLKRRHHSLQSAGGLLPLFARHDFSIESSIQLQISQYTFIDNAVPHMQVTGGYISLSQKGVCP